MCYGQWEVMEILRKRLVKDTANLLISSKLAHQAVKQVHRVNERERERE